MNKLIVESKNDKYFIERLIKHLNIKNIEVDEPICNIDEYRCLDGIGELKKALYEIRNAICWRVKKLIARGKAK